MTKLIWKVLRSRNGALGSVSMPGLPYRKGETVHPEYGKLFAFRDEEGARQFIGHFWSEDQAKLSIWAAQGEGCTEPTDRIPRFYQDYKEFWKHPEIFVQSHTYDGGEGDSMLMLTPDGTIWCDSITLIKRVD